MLSQLSLVLLAMSSIGSTFPVDTPDPTAQQLPPLITPGPNAVIPLSTQQLHEHLRRDVISNIASGAKSIISDVTSAVPSLVASGIPQFFQNLPTGDKVASSLGLQKDQIAALPTQVLNLDPYANWTAQGWSVRFRGNVYKQPNTSNETLEKLADDLFIYGTKLSSLPEDQQAQARNLTAEIFVLQQGDVNVSQISLEP